MLVLVSFSCYIIFLIHIRYLPRFSFFQLLHTSAGLARLLRSGFSFFQLLLQFFYVLVLACEFQFLSVVTGSQISGMDIFSVLVSFSCYEVVPEQMCAEDCVLVSFSCYYSIGAEYSRFRSFSFFQLLQKRWAECQKLFPVLVSFSCYNPPFLRVSISPKFQFLSVVTKMSMAQTQKAQVLVSFSCYTAP